MKHLRIVQLTRLAILATLSLTLLMGCSGQHTKSKAPAFCPSSAFINIPDYEIKELTSKSDAEFHVKMAELLVKYPQLLRSYADLNECWFHYHPGK